MVPRFFVSSTYYDLKHVRERLEKFIEAYGFEPILFESDKVTYQHGKEIDQSAYFEVGLCHVMVLIVGGRYGTPSSQAKLEEERKLYDEDYVSITRKEFETAGLKNIPIMIFIDKNVYSEYQTYKNNQEFFEQLYSGKIGETAGSKKFRFAHVDHLNVFKFIDLVKVKPIKTFDKVEEIESYIRSQLSGMFYLYLESLKKQSDDNKILNTIEELNNVTLRMNEMLTSVGKEILSNDNHDFQKVIDNQFKIMLDFYIDKFSNSIEFEHDLSEEVIDSFSLEEAAKLLYDLALSIDINSIKTESKEWIKKYHEVNAYVIETLNSALSELAESLKIKKFDFRALNNDLRQKVLPYVTDSQKERLLLTRIQDELRTILLGQPF